MEGHTFSADQKVNAVVEAYVRACFQLQFVPSLVYTSASSNPFDAVCIVRQVMIYIAFVFGLVLYNFL